MIKKILMLLLMGLADGLMAADGGSETPEIHDAMVYKRLDFNNLTAAQTKLFDSQVNLTNRVWSSPLNCAVSIKRFRGDYYIRDYCSAVNWLLAHGAKVDDSKIFQDALYPLEGVCPEIVETLLWHGASTDIKQRPLEDIEREIKWQAYKAEHSFNKHMEEDIIVRLKKTRTIIRRHDELKLRMARISSVRMGRSGFLE